MTVLQNYPCALLHCHINHLSCNGSLALAKGDLLTPSAAKSLVFCKLEQCCHWVSSRGEDKDEGGTAVRVRVAAGEVKCRWLDVGRAYLLRDELLNSRNNLIRPDAPQDHQAAGRGTTHTCCTTVHTHTGIR